MTASLFESAFGSAGAAAAFEVSAALQAVLDFEAALVRAEAAEGRIPAAAAQAIAGVCRIGLFDLPSLIAAAAASGDPVTPLLSRLRETVALFDADAAAFVHGAPLRRAALQTALLLQLRRVLALIDRDLGRLVLDALELASLNCTAEEPSCDAIESAVPRLLAAQRALREHGAAALQLDLAAGGGATGAGDPLLPQAVANRVAAQLELAHRAGPSVESHGGLIRLACEVALMCAGVERLVSALQQVGEGGSQTDAVDVAAAVVRAAALRAPQSVAGLLALAAGQAACETVAAEAAALLIAAHAGVAAARRATLACTAGWRTRPPRSPARNRRSTTTTPPAAPLSRPLIDTLLAQAREQANRAPWQRWAD